MSAFEMVDSNLSSVRPGLVGKQTPPEAATPSAIPSSPDEGACLAGSDHVVPRGLAPSSLTLFPSSLEPNTSDPFPLPSRAPKPLSTPVREDRPVDLRLHFAGSAALPSTDVSLPTPPILKTAHNLRLPSFDVLGIAAPHPDRIALQSFNSFSSLGAGPLSKPEDPLHALSPPLARPQKFGGVNEPSPTSPETTRSKVEHLIPIVTPPSEPGTFSWGSFVNVRTAGVGSPPSSDPGVSPSINTIASATSPGPVAVDDLSVVELSDALGMAVWIEKVKEILSMSLILLELWLLLTFDSYRSSVAAH